MLQHQQQPAYTEAVQQQKIVVSNYWVLACDEAKRMLPVNHPVSFDSLKVLPCSVQPVCHMADSKVLLSVQLHCPFPSAEIMGATSKTIIMGFTQSNDLCYFTLDTQHSTVL